MVKMFYESNIVMFVGNLNLQKLIIWNDDTQSQLGELVLNDNHLIINFSVTKKYIILVTIDKIWVYSFEKLTLIHVIDTFYNPNGLLACFIHPLDSKYDFLVYPSIKIGGLSMNRIECGFVHNIVAHTSNLERIYVSDNGRYIVTASEKGTIIRLFDTITLDKINDFRRGADPAKITSLCMNTDNSILIVSSSKGTIHWYNTGIDTGQIVPKNKKLNMYGLKYAELMIPSYFKSSWSFSQLYLTNVSTQFIFDRNINKKVVHVVGSDGQYYLLNFEDLNSIFIEKSIKYYSTSDDPFIERSSTIR